MMRIPQSYLRAANIRLLILLAVSVAIGVSTSALGAYVSYFLDGATGGVMVVLQTLVFLAAFIFAPRHGLLAGRRKARAATEGASP